MKKKKIIQTKDAFCSKDDFMLDTISKICDLLQRSQTGKIILQVSKTNNKEFNESYEK